MTDTTKKADPPKSPATFVLDFVRVSRPGWWIVSVWLYMAPIKATEQLPTTFWPGLLYVCFPLNALVYGLNDYADVEVDVTNDRKGNLLFGPKGMTRIHLKRILQAAILTTFLPLLYWAFHEKQQLARYLVWYALVIVVNVAYNFKVLGHLSEKGPFEVPTVYFGFSLVTVLSFWLNNSASEDTVWGYEPSMKLFGCNQRYWIHLAFLITRTQLWTEYMDYDSDRVHLRGTTLAKLSSKGKARILVLFVLLMEAAWNWRQYQQDTQWQTLFLFSILGVASFIGMEFSPPKASSFVWVALVQSVGGLWLIQDTWHKQVFVS